MTMTWHALFRAVLYNFDDSLPTTSVLMPKWAQEYSIPQVVTLTLSLAAPDHTPTLYARLMSIKVW